MQVRRIHARPEVQADRGRVALASGPLVYCLEAIDNPQQTSYYLRADSMLSIACEPDLLGGMNVIRGAAFRRRQEGPVERVRLTAIPFFAQDNRASESRLDVWIPENEVLAASLGMTAGFTARCSHCFDRDTVGALNDGVAPSSSNDHSIPRHTWWDRRGQTEWVQYDFDRPRRVSSVAVYWWDDCPAGGHCAVPASWRLLYRRDGGWQPVPGDVHYGTEKDRFNQAYFEAVETTSLRIEAELQPDCSGGILEWTVK